MTEYNLGRTGKSSVAAAARIGRDARKRQARMDRAQPRPAVACAQEAGIQTYASAATPAPCLTGKLREPA